MSYDKRAIQRGVAVLIFYILVFAILSFLPSCTTVKYVPVETIRTDTLNHYIHRIDSITQRDSIVEKIYMRGDTVVNEVERYKLVERVKEVADTITEVKTEIKEIPVEVEKELTAWQKFKINFSEFIIGVAVLAISALIIMIVIFRRSKK